MRTRTRVASVVPVLLLGACLDLYANPQDAGHWSEYGFGWNAPGRWHANGDVQFRFRDDWQDFHYFRLEFGPGAHLGQSFDLLVMYRLNPTQENGGKWSNRHFLMIDPTVKLYSSSRWAFDVRSRFQVKLGDQGRSFWRPRPRVSYRFEIGGRKSSWYAGDEFFVQISSLDSRSRINQNRFQTGVKFSLGSNADLDTYYLLRSDENQRDAPWRHIHVLGTSLSFKF